MEKVPVISAKNVNKRYGGVHALVDAQIDCYEGEIHALVGENGAGKSTLIKVLCGATIPDSGSVFLRGKEIKLSSPIDAVRHKIASVFQELSLLPELSVFENVFLGSEPRTKFGLLNLKEMERRTRVIMKELEFDIPVRTLVKDLPLAQQQLVEIAKALSKDPDIIILDEATSALGSKEVDLLFKLMRRLTKEENKTVILISHKMNELEVIADRATIFRDARYITSFQWGEMTNAEIIDRIAGRKIDTIFPEKRKTISREIALEIEELNYQNKLKNINLKVRKGEIFGLAGLSGHGQAELLDVIYGARSIERGHLLIKGKKVRIKNPRNGLKAGIALTPADRKNDGLLLTRTCSENIALTTLSRRSRMGIIHFKEEEKDVDKIIQLLQIKLSGSNQIAGTLSGGNQQKLVIGKAILTNADILLLSDPTRGIDVGTKYEIYQLIRKLAEDGKTVLLYSTENKELLGLCDRIAVFKQGKVVTVLEDKEMTENEILKAALGMAEEVTA